MVVGQLHVVGDAVSLSAGVVASSADGRELAAEDDVLGFFGGVDVWDGDGLGSAIEGAVDEALGVFVDADYGGQSPEVAGAGEVAEVCVIDSGVFAFEPYGVDSVRLRDGAEGVDVVGVGEADDGDGDFAGVDFFFDAIGSELHYLDRLLISSGCLRSR